VGRGQRLGLILAAVVVAGVAFVLARPGDDGDSPEPEPTATEQTRPQEPAAQPPKPSFEKIRIAGGEVTGGKRRVTVRKGETARIQVVSDAPDEIHLHGYDVAKKVAPGRPAKFVVKADIEGVFEIEAHDLGHVIVGELVVEPR
jgi:FtsP/CotA-like multicopper oxidase with cupredoxin domain